MKKIRVACSVRVSHEEQVRDGFSIQTQIDHLKNYIENNKEYVLVDFYIDEGVSADKLKKRTEMQRLLKDVEAGKIDMILFTKLDRWFRSVEKYYDIQKILDKHNVTWKAILEDYETQTASGRFKVNIMLSVAQNERERTSERIKDVFQYKVKKGEALYGNGAMPFGFEVVDKKIVHKKEDEPILMDLIKFYCVNQSVRKTVIYAREKHNKFLSYNNFYRLLQNPLLHGTFRDNHDYCEPYITKQKFDEIQELMKRNIRVKENNHTYIFSAMIKCPVCGSHLVGTVGYIKKSDGTKYPNFGYRCEKHYLGKKKACTFNKSKSQLKIENEVMNKLSPMLNQYLIDAEFEHKKTPPKVDAKKIQAEIDRLNNMYLKGRISEDVYDAKYTELNNKLKIKDDSPKPVSPAIKSLANMNIDELYNSFSIEEKQKFMRGLIKEIHIDENYNVVDIIFL